MKAARVICDLADMPKPPAQLLLGAGVLASYREKLAAVLADLDSWEDTTLGVDYEA